MAKVCTSFMQRHVITSDICTSDRWESGQFHLGQFQDDCFKALPPADKKTRCVSPKAYSSAKLTPHPRGMKMNFQTVRCFVRAIRYGSKYIYQTLPRVLTIWLDLAEDPRTNSGDIFKKINDEVNRAIKTAPTYKVRPQHGVCIVIASSMFASGIRRFRKSFLA